MTNAQNSGAVELLPCPCCGSGPARQPGRFTQASFSGVEVMDEIYHPYVWCGSCCLRTRSCDSVSEAIAAWNLRATPAPSDQAGWQDKKMDWVWIAHAAGENGIRYRTNTALVNFLNEIGSIPTAPTLTAGEGGGDE